MLAFYAGDGILTFTRGGELYVARRIEIPLAELMDANAALKQDHLERIALAVQRSLDHFEREYPYVPLAKLLVAPLPRDIGLADHLAANIDGTVEPIDLAAVMDFAAVPELKQREIQARYLSDDRRGTARRGSRSGMSQQINLLNPLFRKKRFSFTSPAAMLYGIGIVAALTVAAAVYESNRLHEIEAQARAVAQALKEIQAQHEALTAKSGVRKPDPGLEAKVLDLSAQVKVRQQIVDALKGGTVGTTAGFSEYMRAFSRQRVEGVWLTAFDIAAGGSDLTIAGRALSADLIPGLSAAAEQGSAYAGPSVRFGHDPPGGRQEAPRRP